MSGDAAAGGEGPGSKVDKILSTLKLGGKVVAGPMVQSMLREQVVVLLRQYEPDVLEQYIQVNYPLVQKELPQNYKNALANVGPQFAGEIQQMVRPAQVLDWLENPDGWLDVDEHPEKAEEVRECHRVITETPGGQEWLADQCVQIWKIADVV